MRKVSGAPEISPEKRLNQRQKSRVTKTGGIPVLCVSAGKCGGQHPGMLPGFSFDTGSVLIGAHPRNKQHPVGSNIIGYLHAAVTGREP